ncbi:MAG TPA: FHA domain-containing protein, partial [Kofleriaceae bacterium]|nr:FHA domain-containing protein [Kofleriaceae bacterium]
MPLNTTVTTLLPDGGDQLFLIVVGERILTTEALPNRGQVSIGRAPDCDVRIDDVSISRNHAILELDPPLRIYDNQSANGTWLADKRLLPNVPVEVSIDQAIRLGSITVIVQRRAAAANPVRRLRTHEYFESRLEDECDRGHSFAIMHVIGHDVAAVRRAMAPLLVPDDLVASYAPGELEVLLVGDPSRAQLIERTLETELASRTVDARIGS